MNLDEFLRTKNTVIVEGYSQQLPAQIEDLKRLTSTSKNIMEIGFNAGHSSEIFLKNNPDCHVTSFDIGDYMSVLHAKDYIDLTYPGRHTLIIGNSTITIPKYVLDNPGKVFDFIFIDGGHDYPVPADDLENCSKLADKNTTFAIDDVAPSWTNGPTRALNEFVKSEKVIVRNITQYNVGRGMAWGEYVKESITQTPV
jgi:predicted O-methyltransferase YrrM